MKLLLLTIFILGNILNQSSASDFGDAMLGHQTRVLAISQEVLDFMEPLQGMARQLIFWMNRYILQVIGRDVTEIMDLLQEVHEYLNEQAAVIGNQNPCLVSLEERLRTGAIESGSEYQVCAAAASASLSNLTLNTFYTYNNLVMRQAHSAKIALFIPFGYYNSLTNQDEIVTMTDDLITAGFNAWESTLQQEVFADLVRLAYTAQPNVINEVARCSYRAVGGFRSYAALIRAEANLCNP